METKKDDNTMLTTHEPNTTNLTQMMDKEEKFASNIDSKPEEATPKEIHFDSGHHELKSVNEETGVQNFSGRLLFLDKAKMKVDVTLQDDTWLYNEIISL